MFCRKIRDLKDIVKNRWRLLWYFISVTSLTIYVICNWRYVIDFTPFTNFDGNNLLFVVWIIIVTLPFIRLESEKGKAGLDTGSNWSNVKDNAELMNTKPPASKEDDINALEAKINEVERSTDK